MTRELDLELLLDSPDTSDYTFDTLETPAHPSTIRDSQGILDDASMQCEVSPLLDTSPSFQSVQGNGVQMALESRYYQAKSSGNVDDFGRIVSMLEDEQGDTWMQVIKCKCLRFIFESHLVGGRYREAIACINSILAANIPRVQMQRIIKAVLETVEREGDASSMNWCVFVEALAEHLLSSLDKVRDSDLWTLTGLLQLGVLVKQKKRYALKFGPLLEDALMASVEDFVTERNVKLLKVLHLMVHAYKDAFDFPHLIACAERAKNLKSVDGALFTDITIQSGMAHIQLRSFSVAEAMLGRVAPELIPFCNPKLYTDEVVAALKSTELPARNELNAGLWDRIKEFEQIGLTRGAITTFSESRHDVGFEELPIAEEGIIAQAIMHHPLAKVARMDQKSGRVVFCAYFGA